MFNESISGDGELHRETCALPVEGITQPCSLTNSSLSSDMSRIYDGNPRPGEVILNLNRRVSVT